MFQSNSGAYVADDVNAHVARTGAQGFGCIGQGLMWLLVPAFTIEVFIRQRMGWIYVVYGTIWSTMFMAFYTVFTKLETPGMLVFIPLVWLMSLCQLIALPFTREPVHSSSCGVPHALWRIVFGRRPGMMQFVMVMLEAPLVFGIGYVIGKLVDPFVGGFMVVAACCLLLKNIVSFLVWLFRRQMHTDSRIAADSMQSLNQQTSRAANPRPSQPRVVRLTPPPR